MPRRRTAFDRKLVRGVYAAVGANAAKAAAVINMVTNVGITPWNVRNIVREREDGDSTHGRFAPYAVQSRVAKMPPIENPAFFEGRTLYPKTVADPAGSERVLKSGANSAKIGAVIRKGPWKGFPVYQLSLEERKTCPTDCPAWRCCLTPETPVLMSDLRWTTLGKIKVGDRVAAFDEEASANWTRMTRIANVEKVGRKRTECFRITTDKCVVIASHDHLWLSRSGRKGYRWIDTKQVRVGDRLPYLCAPWATDETYDGGRLRGFLEGEGTACTWGNGRYAKARVEWSQVPGKLFDEICSIATAKGFSIKKGTVTSGCRASTICHGRVNGGWRETLRFLGTFRPTRLIEKAEAFYPHHDIIRMGDAATVLKIEPVGRREVVTIQTSERTLVANGLFTHNCYGNGMHLARRFRHGPALEARIAVEVADLAAKHPAGFAVRLHVLGDFYSTDYVNLWRVLLLCHKPLHVWGYTHRTDVRNDPIARDLVRLIDRMWPRFAVRLSDFNLPEYTASIVDHPLQAPKDAIVCPEQWTRSGRRAESCSTCGLCWTSTRRIAFIRH